MIIGAFFTILWALYASSSEFEVLRVACLTKLPWQGRTIYASLSYTLRISPAIVNPTSCLGIFKPKFSSILTWSTIFRILPSTCFTSFITFYATPKPIWAIIFLASVTVDFSSLVIVTWSASLWAGPTWLRFINKSITIHTDITCLERRTIGASRLAKGTLHECGSDKEEDREDKQGFHKN